MSASLPRRVALVGAAFLIVSTAAPGAASAAPNTDPFVPPSVTVQTPSTDDCAQRSQPPPAGQTPPGPLPVPTQPVGGPQLGRCGLILPGNAAALPSDISAGAWLIADL